MAFLFDHITFTTYRYQVSNILGKQVGPSMRMACLSSLRSHGFPRPSGVGLMLDGSGGTDFFGRQKAIIFNIHDVFIYIPVFHPSPLMGVFPFSVLLDTPVTVSIRAVGCD